MVWVRTLSPYLPGYSRCGTDADSSFLIFTSFIRVADNSRGTTNQRLEIEYPGRIFFVVIPVG
jgi:hypothetical protein